MKFEVGENDLKPINNHKQTKGHKTTLTIDSQTKNKFYKQLC